MNSFEAKWVGHMTDAKNLEHLNQIHDVVCLKKCKAFHDCGRCIIEQQYQFLKEGFEVMQEIEAHIKARAIQAKSQRKIKMVVQDQPSGFIVYVPYTRQKKIK